MRAVVPADTDYADDMVLTSDRVEQAQELLTRIERNVPRLVFGYMPRQLPLLPLITAREEVTDLRDLDSWFYS